MSSCAYAACESASTAAAHTAPLWLSSASRSDSSAPRKATCELSSSPSRLASHAPPCSECSDGSSPSNPSGLAGESVQISSSGVVASGLLNLDDAEPDEAAPAQGTARPEPLMRPHGWHESLSGMGHVALSIGVVMGLGLLLCVISLGLGGTQMAVLQMLAMGCTHGGRGLSQVLAATTGCGLSPSLEQPWVPPSTWKLIGGAISFIYFVILLAESMLIAQLAALVARGARGLSSLVDPRAVQRRARATVGVFSLLFVIVMLVNGVGGSTVGPISSSRAMRARASRTRGLCYSVQYVIR